MKNFTLVSGGSFFGINVGLQLSVRFTFCPSMSLTPLPRNELRRQHADFLLT